MEGFRFNQTPSQQAHPYTSVVPLQIKPQSCMWFFCATFVQLSSLSQTAGCRGTAVIPRGSDHHEGPRKLNAVQTETPSWLGDKSVETG